MAHIQFDLPTSTAPTASLLFRESIASITRKRIAPIQHIEIAISGKEYVRSLSGNTEELWEIDFRLLPEANTGAGSSISGYTSLKNFLTSTSTGAGYSENTFEITDPDGDSLTGRYISGLESFTEGGIRQQGKSGSFTGTLLFRKTITG